MSELFAEVNTDEISTQEKGSGPNKDMFGYFKDMEESWTIFISKVKQAVSASTPFVKILRGMKAKLPLKTQAVALIKSKKEAWKKSKTTDLKRNGKTTEN